MNTKPESQRPKKPTPAEAAAGNGGVLTRDAEGVWRGASMLHRYSAETIAACVREGNATYTRFKPGTRAALEVRFDLKDLYAQYQIT